MKKVELRMNELTKYTIVKNLVDNKWNKNAAAIRLNLSKRQIDRLIIKYKETGNQVLYTETADKSLRRY